MKEIRAVVIGLVVVVLVAMAYSCWQRPGKEFHKISGYRVEIQKTEGDSRKRVSFSIPIVTVARIASMIPMGNISTNWDSDWGSGDVTGKDILDAAAESAPGKPGVIEKDGNRIEVMADGLALEITVKDSWDKTVRVRVPRALVEGFADRRRISIGEVLKRLDELGPGDVVRVDDGDSVVTISAEPR